jgi:hypothetical protein
MKLIETQRGIEIETTNGIETVHVNHSHDNLKGYKEDVYSPFLVFEHCTNFARVHLLTASSEDDALQEVFDYLIEQENDDPNEINLMGVEKINL